MQVLFVLRCDARLFFDFSVFAVVYERIFCYYDSKMICANHGGGALSGDVLLRLFLFFVYDTFSTCKVFPFSLFRDLKMLEKTEVTYGDPYPNPYFPGGACYVRTVLREKLRKYLSEHGRDIFQEPKALRLYLLQEEGRFPQEIDGLLRLIEEGYLPPFPEEKEREAFLKRIVREMGFSPEDALWFLESWEGVRHMLEASEEQNHVSSEDSVSAGDSTAAAVGLVPAFQMFLASPETFVPPPSSSVAPGLESFVREAAPAKEFREPENPSSEPLSETPPEFEEEAPPEAETSPEGEEILAPFSSPEEETEEPFSDAGEMPRETSGASAEELLEEKELATDLPEHSGALPFSEEEPRPETSLQEELPFRGISSEELAPASEETEAPEDDNEVPGVEEPKAEEILPFREVPSVHGEMQEDFEEPYPDYVGSREHAVLFDDSLRRKRMFRLALAGIFGIAAAGVVGYTMWRNTPTNLLERGRSRLQKEDYPGAVQLFKKALQKDEDQPEGYRLLGEALYQQGEYKEALKAFEETIRKVSADALLYNDIAYAQLSLGNLEEATGSFREALRMVPLYPQAQKGLGLTHFQKGELGKAAKELQKALDSLPEDGEMLLALGQIHVQSGSLDRGETLFARVLELDPENESARLEMEELGREKSLQQAREAAKAARLSEYLAVGEKLLVSGDLAPAEEIYRKALEESPQSPEARVGLLDALLMQRRSEDAQALVEEARNMQKGTLPEDFLHYLEQTLSSYQRAEEERAARHKAYDMAIARASEMREQSRMEGALAAYRGILEEEEYPPAYLGLARTLAKAKDYKGALEAYERCEILFDSSPEFSEKLQGEIEGVRTDLARQELAEELGGLYSRARTLERQGKREEARKLYEAILRRDNSYSRARRRLERLAQTSEEAGPEGSAAGGASKAGAESPGEPPEWLVLPDGQPAHLKMEIENERLDLRKSPLPEIQDSFSRKSENLFPGISSEAEAKEESPSFLVEKIFIQANIFARQGHYGEAEKLYRKALDRAPLRGDIRHNLAWVLGMQGKTRGAFKEFRQALLQMGPNSATFYNLAYLYFQQQDEARGFRALEQALGAPENSGGARLFRFPQIPFPLSVKEKNASPSGESLKREETLPGNRDDSAQAENLSRDLLEKSSKLNPRKASLYEALILWGERMDARAAMCGEKNASSPGEARGLSLVGHALCSRGEYEEARAFLESSLKKNPGKGITYLLLAQASKSSGNMDLARKAMLVAAMYGV